MCKDFVVTCNEHIPFRAHTLKHTHPHIYRINVTPAAIADKSQRICCSLRICQDEDAINVAFKMCFCRQIREMRLPIIEMNAKRKENKHKRKNS